MKSFNDLSKLIGGTAIAQAILFLFTPIIAKFYTPDEFGLYELFISVVNTIGVVTTLQYDKALLIPIDKKEFLALSKGVFFIILTYVSIILFVLLFADSLISLSPSISPLLPVKWLIPIIVFFRGINLLLMTISNANGKFGLMSLEKMIRASSIVSLNIVIKKFRLFNYGLIMSEVLSGFSSLVLYSYSLVKGGLISQKKDCILSISDVKDAFKKYSDFPLYGLPKSVFFALTSNFPILVIVHYYGFYEAGLYGLGIRLLSKPVMLLANSSSALFKKDVRDELCVKGTTIEAVFRILKSQISISIGPFLIGYFSLELVFNWFFPSEWLQAIDAIRALFFMYFFKTVISPVAYIFVVYKKQGLDLILNICLFFSSIGAMLLINEIYHDFVTSLKAYSLVYSTFYIVYLFISIKLSRKNETSY